MGIATAAIAIAIAILLFGIWISLEGRLRPLVRDLARLERKLDTITTHLGIIEPEPAGLEAVDTLLHDGKRIAAIKRYREITGSDLLEAKQAVDLRATAGHAE